jgi:type VI protein secretion system component VasK
MITWFFTSKAGRWIITAGAIFIAIFIAILGVYNAGKAAQKADELKARHKGIKRAKEIERGIARLPNGAAADELRRNWARG